MLRQRRFKRFAFAIRQLGLVLVFAMLRKPLFVPRLIPNPRIRQVDGAILLIASGPHLTGLRRRPSGRGRRQHRRLFFGSQVSHIFTPSAASYLTHSSDRTHMPVDQAIDQTVTVAVRVATSPTLLGASALAVSRQVEPLQPRRFQFHYAALSILVPSIALRTRLALDRLAPP